MCREVISTSKPIKDVATAYGVGPETLYVDGATLNSGNHTTHGDATPRSRAVREPSVMQIARNTERVFSASRAIFIHFYRLAVDPRITLPSSRAQAA